MTPLHDPADVAPGQERRLRKIYDFTQRKLAWPTVDLANALFATR
jgi:hypothetical protein